MARTSFEVCCPRFLSSTRRSTMRSDEPSKISRRSRFQGASAACAPWPVPSSTTSAVLTKGAGGTVAEPLGPGRCDELSGEALDGDVLAALHGDWLAAICEVTTRSSSSQPQSRACQSRRTTLPKDFMPSVCVWPNRSGMNRAATAFSKLKPPPPVSPTGAPAISVYQAFNSRRRLPVLKVARYLRRCCRRACLPWKHRTPST